MGWALARNLAAFEETVTAIASGGLTRGGEAGDDTVGRIAQSVNAMIDAFSAILYEVHETAAVVSTSSTEILAAATQITKGATLGSENASQISDASGEQARHEDGGGVRPDHRQRDGRVGRRSQGDDAGGRAPGTPCGEAPGRHLPLPYRQLTAATSTSSPVKPGPTEGARALRNGDYS
jgi:hypothetical protein